MECIYSPELTENSHFVELSTDETRHAFVRRMKSGDRVLLSNGLGLSCIGTLQFSSKKNAGVMCETMLDNYNEILWKLRIGIGLLDDKDRIEWLVEKCVELGVWEIHFLQCERSSKRQLDSERLHKKAIAALKQCKRSKLPQFFFQQSLHIFLELLDSKETILFADMKRNSNTAQLEKTENTPVTVLVGPEGGMSEKETTLILNDKRTMSIALGQRRLRAETAAITLAANVVPLLEYGNPIVNFSKPKQ